MSARALLRRSLRLPNPALAPQPAMEAIYRSLFLRGLAALGEDDRFHPVGGAANHGLLHLILRIGTELQPRAVLDIGAGQSSLLWSMLQRRGLVGEVTTLENDKGWAAAIGAEVDHPLVVTPLAPRTVGRRQQLSYEWERLAGPYDVIVCDGPIGVARDSRAGVLALIDETLPDDFIVILDDAERRGEQDTAEAIHRRLQRLGRDYRAGVVSAAKTQVIFAAGRYAPAIHLA